MFAFRFLLCLLSATLLAQVPETTLYLAQYDEQGKKVEGVRALPTPKGYNNQPSFLSNDALLFAGQYEDQADIYRYDIAGNSITQITFTQESEYSPTLTPDGKHISTVRVAHDGKQRLWQYPLEGGAPELLIPKTEKIGYHLWLSPDELALFIVGEPHLLKLAKRKGGPTQYIADYPGRCLANIPNSQYFSAISQTPKGQRLFRIHKKTLDMKVIATPLEGVQDFAWTPTGAVLMGKGTKLYRFLPGQDKSWQEIADLSGTGITHLMRMAVAPDGKTLALVSGS